jgi:hypothetical protein
VEVTRVVLLLAVAGCAAESAAPPPEAESPPTPAVAPPAATTTAAIPTATASPPAAPRFVDDAFAFYATGAATTEVAPIYITLALNVNDFPHPEVEARSVQRFLDTTAKIGADVIETSFTGEVLDALSVADPALLLRIKARRPVINEHPRILNFRGLSGAAYELFRFDLTTLKLDRRSPGPLVGLQRTFGVTPREGAGVLGEALRARWKEGEESRALRAQGYAKVERGGLFAHPKRVTGALLSTIPDAAPGDDDMQAWMDLYRTIARVAAGERTWAADPRRGLEMLAWWVHLGKLQGLDIAALPTVASLVDPRRPVTTIERANRWGPSASEASAFEARPAPDQLQVLDRAYAEMCAAACALHDPAAEIAARLGSLDPHRAWAGRMTWHASDATTLGGWSAGLYGRGRLGPEKLRGQPLRPESDTATVHAGHDRMLAAIAANPRVRFVSIDHDTQWAPENAPANGWREAFGVDLAAFPSGFDADALEARAAELGFHAEPEEEEGKAGKAGKAEGGRKRRSR